MDLGEQYNGQINFVKINIGTSDGRPVGNRYGVRGTPAFFLLDPNGERKLEAAGIVLNNADRLLLQVEDGDAKTAL